MQSVATDFLQNKTGKRLRCKRLRFPAKNLKHNIQFGFMIPALPFPHFLFLLIPLKSPKSKALKEKQPKNEPKRRGYLHTIKKTSEKDLIAV